MLGLVGTICQKMRHGHFRQRSVSRHLVTTTNRKEYPVAFITGDGYLNTWGGTLESIYQIVKHIQMPILTITAGPRSIAQRLREGGFPVVEAPLPITLLHNFRRSNLLSKFKVLVLSIRYCYRVFWILRKYRVQAVYTVIGPSVILAPVPAKLARAKLITGVRGTPHNMTKWSWIFRLSDRIVVLSNEMKTILADGLRRFSIPNLESRLVVIYNGVDVEESRGVSVTSGDIRTSFGIKNDDVVILYVAWFRPWKGQLKFITQVLPALYQNEVIKRKTHIAFLGSSSTEEEKRYERTCQRRVSELWFRSKIHFAGFQENVWPWYRSADIVVLASEPLEGMPRAVIEAMACGKPVVTYDVCSVKELLMETGAGIVVTQGDAPRMAAAIADLIKNVDLRNKMGAKGLDFAKSNLDIRRISAYYKSLFEGVCYRHKKLK